MPRTPGSPQFEQPPKGKSIPATFQEPKATDLFGDDTVVVHKEVDAPAYVTGAIGDPHPDAVTYPNHKLDIIQYSADGKTAIWTYTYTRGPVISTSRTQDGQTATETATLVDEGTSPPVLDALTIGAKDENLTNGRTRRTITTVPSVFPATMLGVEGISPRFAVPPEFHGLLPTITVGVTEEGDVEFPTLAEGQIAGTEQQITEFTKRVESTSLDLSLLPATLVDQQTSSAFGFGGVMDVVRTLSDDPQTIDEGLEVVSSSVKHLGSGLTLKETEQLSGNDATLELTDGGSGFTSDPTVAFSGGSAAGGGTATSSISPGVTAPSTSVVRNYSFNGDDRGVFYYLATLGNNGVWRNPQTFGNIVITAPEALDAGTFDQIVDREQSNVYLALRDACELHFDLKAGRTLLCNKLTYQQRSDYGSSTTNVGIQGSNDGVTWGPDTVDFTLSGSDPGKWKAVDVNFVTAYRYFRLILPTGSSFLSIGEFELYGTLTLAGETSGGDVTSIDVTAGGVYASPPTVVFTGGGGSGAAAVAILSGTAIASVQITNPGANYTSPPGISFTGGIGASDPATATATVAAGVSSVSVTTGGSGYSTAPIVTFQSPDGSAATAHALIGRGILSIPITNPGVGYTSDPTVVIAGGGGSGASATAQRAHTVASTTVTAPGSGYTSDPLVTASGGGGSDATFLALRGVPLLSIAVTTPGHGYTSAPTVAITGGGGSGATGTAVLGYTVDSITVTSSGSGYSSNPTVAITGGGGSGATAIAQLLGRGVDSIDPTAGGSYLTRPTVTIQGDGSGATAAAHMGVVGSPTIVAPGTGYMVNDVLTIVGGTSTTAAQLKVLTVGGGGDILTLSILTEGDYTVLPANPVSVTGGAGTLATFTLHWEIISIDVVTPGSGYVATPTVIISGTGGATASLLLSASPSIKITLVNPGAGYTSAPTVTISGGGGTGGTATAALSASGSVKSVTLTAPGSGFTGNAIIGFTGGAGSGAVASGARNTAASGTVSSISVVNPGTGYTTAPTLAITGGGGSGATADATLSSGGQITGVTVTAPGSGFTSDPTITFTGGGGTGAAAGVMLSTSGAVSSIVVTAPGSGYITAPTVILTGGGGTGATADATLGASGPVVLLTLTHAGTYFVAPTVTISGGGGTGATAIYHLGNGWPVLEEFHTDPTDSVLVRIEKKLIVPGSLVPSGFVEIQSVDKWRSIQMVSSIDLRTLPPPDLYLSTQHISLPDDLISVTPLWSTSNSQSGSFSINSQTGTSSVEATVHGSIQVVKRNGFRGAALARVERTFFFGPPPDASVPLPTIIRPSTGTGLIIGGSQNASVGGSSYTPPLNINGEVAQVGDLLPGSTPTNPIIYFGGGSPTVTTSATGGVSKSIQAIDISDVLTPGLTLVSGYTNHGDSNAGDGSLPTSVDSSGSFILNIPPSTPTGLPPGTAILSEVLVEKWRFGLFVRTIIYVIVPGVEESFVDELWLTF